MSEKGMQQNIYALWKTIFKGGGDLPFVPLPPLMYWYCWFIQSTYGTTVYQYIWSLWWQFSRELQRWNPLHIFSVGFN